MNNQSKCQDIFERVEKKYLLVREKYELLKEKIEPYMSVDEYGLHTICNLYYDTDNYELIRKSIEKPPYKEKLRLRSYGIPTEDSPVFLELKKKWNGVVYKRRECMTLEEVNHYMEDGIKPDKESQILREIDYFKKFYQPVPKVYLAYDRVALFEKNEGPVRITFDTNIRSRNVQLNLSQGDAGELLMKNGNVLMEIKVGGAYPMWLVKILSDLRIYPASFSKYGSVYKQALKEEKEERKFDLCLQA